MTQPLEDEKITAFSTAMHEVLMQLPNNKKFNKAKTQFLDNIWEDMQYSVIDTMSKVLEGFIYDMASKIVNEILEGSEDQMRRYLALDGYTGREYNHSVIHGTLFETGAIALRKKIVLAHKDLIQNEHITDLESQITSLVKQINKKDVEINNLNEARILNAY